MKHVSILTPVVMIALIISACGAEPTPPPTVNPLDIQSTVAAAALTMVAETQAAIPTATPIPPTETPTNTPPPTVTLPPLAGTQLTFTPIPNSNSGGGDPCVNAVLPATL